MGQASTCVQRGLALMQHSSVMEHHSAGMDQMKTSMLTAQPQVNTALSQTLMWIVF